MNDPQIWTLIGIFAAIMLSGMSLMTTLIMRATTSAIDGLRGEMNARFDGVRGEMNGRFDGVRGEMNGLRGEMNARFDSVDRKIEHLDRDVAALSRKVFGESPER